MDLHMQSYRSMCSIPLFIECFVSGELQHLAVGHDGNIIYRAGRASLWLALEIRSENKVMIPFDSLHRNFVAAVILYFF